MNFPVTNLLPASGRWSFRLVGRQRLAILSIAFIAALSVLMRLSFDTSADISWLLTLGEEMLAGRRPYVDLIEVNPPASIYLYLPAVLLGRWTFIAAETWVNILVFLSSPLSMGLSGYLLRGTSALRVARSILGVSAITFALAILPFECFGQREHIAIICLLPWLAAAIARYEGRPLHVFPAIAAGIAGGLVFAIKPPFGLPLALVSLSTLAVMRSWRWALLPEHIACAFVATTYTVLTYVLHPEFWRDTMPLLQTLYIPFRNWDLLKENDLVLFSIAGGIVALARPIGLAKCPAVFVPVLASAGFLAATIWQGKYWTYHHYTFMSLAALACIAASLQRSHHDQAKFRLVSPSGQAAIAVLIFLRFSALLYFVPDFKPVAEALRRIAPRPSIMSLTTDIAMAFPATRMVEGRWISQFCSLWIINYASVLRPSARGNSQWLTQIDAAEAMLIESVRRDFVEGRPDAIIADEATLGWARRIPDLARELDGFELFETITFSENYTTLVLRRKPPQN